MMWRKGTLRLYAKMVPRERRRRVALQPLIEEQKRKFVRDGFPLVPEVVPPPWWPGAARYQPLDRLRHRRRRADSLRQPIVLHGAPRRFAHEDPQHRMEGQPAFLTRPLVGVKKLLGFTSLTAMSMIVPMADCAGRALAGLLAPCVHGAKILRDHHGPW